MTNEASITHEWADEARAIVKRITTDYPVDLAELQRAIDEGTARLVMLPAPEPHPSKEEYEKNWAGTGLTFEEVCAVIDRRNEDNPDVQERLQILASIKQWQEWIADWRAKVAG